jgi:heme/copper-type cytochrome/quinol oxidase subunit 3
MHVTGGVIYLSIILLNSLRKEYTAANYNGVEIAGLYWHFVDLVWILVFTFVYLI